MRKFSMNFLQSPHTTKMSFLIEFSLALKENKSHLQYQHPILAAVQIQAAPL